MVTVLCVDADTNYKQIPGLDLYDKTRDAYSFTGNNKVITHAPCQQWSRMKAFAKDNKEERELAFHCFDLVNRNGGIFEHPNGSSFFRAVNADRKKIVKVYQSWFGFLAKKETLLYVHDVDLLPTPLSFDAITKTVDQISYKLRSRMTISFCQWLVGSVQNNAKF